ncbi:MAG TPA: dephospho-CoA kinase [Bdellovibrionales bacterium]|nr:dephospho-CoA kinase [Bdellovibrionales bacterium]
MKWIGLTGGIASGKTTVANGLRSRGFAVVDADELAKRAVEKGSPGLAKIAQVFGPDILLADGGLDRAKLGGLIFARPDLRLELERIVHPEVRRLSALEKDRLEQEGRAIAFYDVPLLFEKQMEPAFDAVVLVFASESLQRARLAARNRLSDAEVTARLASQLPLSAKRAKAHFVVENDGSLADLEREVDLLVKNLRSRFKF